MSEILTWSYWQSVLIALTKTVRLFPRELAMAAVTTGAVILHVESGLSEVTGYVRIALASIIAMNLAFALHIIRRSGRITGLVDLLLWIAGSALLGWYVYGLEIAEPRGIASYAFLVVAIHALVSSSWLSFGSAARFWNANMRMFTKGLIALLFASIAETGVTLAVVSFRVLFQVEWAPNLEIHLNLFCLLFLSVLFFLHAHQDLDNVDQMPTLGKALDVLVRFVLLPLILLFTAILGAYGVRLVSTQILPEMTYYVLWLNGVTLFSIVLSWPERTNAALPWKFLHQFAVPIQAPLLGLAIWAWSRHLLQSGISYDGYTTAALLTIATTASLAAVVRRGLDPRVIPAVGLLIFASTSAGPLGISAVVERSLTARGKTDNFNEWSSVGQPSYRVARTGRTFTSSLIDGVWQGAFHVGNYGDDPLVVVSDDSGSTIQLQPRSTRIVLWSPQIGDTIRFDAARCFASESDSLRPLTIADSLRTITVVCSELTLKRQPADSVWSINAVSASVTVIPRR